MEIHEKKIKLDDLDLLQTLSFDQNILQQLEKRFKSVITLRGNHLFLKGSKREVKVIAQILKELSYVLQRNGALEMSDISSIIEILDSESKPVKDSKTRKDNVIYYGYKDVIKSRTKRQLEYFHKVQKSDLVFSVGPAGTGKTFLAVAMALNDLKNNNVSRIIITRPAVEAGESLGFLPGDLTEKLDPYLRPLTDAMFYMVGADKFKSMMEKNIIEITPLAYMRGRTLNDAFIILDEAQNATVTQMKMFLTRLGANSKAVVTGDITQIDLKEKSNSGLINAIKLLKGLRDIEFVYFSKKDVVRHKLVAKIISAYERENKKNLENQTDS